MNRILIIDDEPEVAEVINQMLISDGYGTAVAERFDAAMKHMERDHFDLAVVDLRLNDKSGIELMASIKQVDPALPMIIITGHGSIEMAVEAMRSGTCGFIQEPFTRKELLFQIDSCLEKKRLSQEIEPLPLLAKERYHVENIICRSEKMFQILELIRTIADNDSNVHIHGETGAGKELIARSIHATGRRRDAPFVAINCGAIPETLFESELFGYVKGAFTGAEQDKRGLIAQANGGTLFLDEISEMSLNTQKKLLRVIEEREFYPVGSSQPVQFDLRIITASNKELKDEIAKGKFREDLYYRIYVISIALPPLRERKEDLMLLAEHFLSKICTDMNVAKKEFSHQAIQNMMQYDWPGNVRELKNVIEHAVVMSEKDIIEPETVLFSDQKSRSASIKPYYEAKKNFEKNYLIELIEYARGNISQAAKIAGKNRTQLYSMLKKFHMDPKNFRR